MDQIKVDVDYEIIKKMMQDVKIRLLCCVCLTILYFLMIFILGLFRISEGGLDSVRWLFLLGWIILQFWMADACWKLQKKIGARRWTILPLLGWLGWIYAIWLIKEAE